MRTGPRVVFDPSLGPSTSTVLALDSHSVVVTPNSSFSLICVFKCFEIDSRDCEPFKWSRSLLSQPSNYVPLPMITDELAIERNESYDASTILHRRLQFTSVQFNTSSIYHCQTPSMMTPFLIRVMEGKRLLCRLLKRIVDAFFSCTSVQLGGPNCILVALLFTLWFLFCPLAFVS